MSPFPPPRPPPPSASPRPHPPDPPPRPGLPRPAATPTLIVFDTFTPASATAAYACRRAAFGLLSRLPRHAPLAVVESRDTRLHVRDWAPLGDTHARARLEARVLPTSPAPSPQSARLPLLDLLLQAARQPWPPGSPRRLWCFADAEAPRQFPPRADTLLAELSHTLRSHRVRFSCFVAAPPAVIASDAWQPLRQLSRERHGICHSVRTPNDWIAARDALFESPCEQVRSRRAVFDWVESLLPPVPFACAAWSIPAELSAPLDSAAEEPPAAPAEPDSAWSDRRHLLTRIGQLGREGRMRHAHHLLEQEILGLDARPARLRHSADTWRQILARAASDLHAAEHA